METFRPQILLGFPFLNKCDINWSQVKKHMQLDHMLERNVKQLAK